MTSILVPGHAEIYNALPDVEDADEERKSRIMFDNFLDDFARIVVEAGLEKIAGPLLLHSHFAVSGDTVIVERLDVLADGRPALVAYPQAVNPEAVPVRWKWQPEIGQFHPLEYCTDPVAVSAARKLSQDAHFLRTVGRLLESYDLQDVIGLTVLDRSLELKEVGSGYFERSCDGMSITTVENSSSCSLTYAIATAWAATIIHPDDGLRAKPQTKCVQICSCSDHQYAHKNKGHSK